MLPGARQFMITLRRSKERAKETLWHLSTRNLYPEVFYGYDIDRTQVVTFNFFKWDRGEASTYRIGDKTVNIYLSHYALWQACSLLPGDAFVIYEDDVRVKINWQSLMSEAQQDLPSDWDILFMGSCCCVTHASPQHIKGRIYRVKHAMCLHAYAVRKKALPLLLETLETVDSPVDVAICLSALPKLNAYAVLPRIAHQSNTSIPN